MVGLIKRNVPAVPNVNGFYGGERIYFRAHLWLLPTCFLTLADTFLLSCAFPGLSLWGHAEQDVFECWMSVPLTTSFWTHLRGELFQAWDTAEKRCLSPVCLGVMPRKTGLSHSNSITLKGLWSVFIALLLGLAIKKTVNFSYINHYLNKDSETCSAKSVAVDCSAGLTNRYLWACFHQADVLSRFFVFRVTFTVPWEERFSVSCTRIEYSPVTIGSIWRLVIFYTCLRINSWLMLPKKIGMLNQAALIVCV